MKIHGRKQNPPLNVAQFHSLIREYAIRKGMAIPETDEEFALLEKSIDLSRLPKHDFEQVFSMITDGEAPTEKIIEFPKADASFVEEFAMAARNGAEIPPETKKQMEADRAVAQRRRRSK